MADENPLNDAARRERQLARRLIVHEAGGNLGAPGMVEATERAFNRLYRHLFSLIGQDGFDAVAQRALYLAARECAYLRSVRAKCMLDQYRLDGLDAAVAGRQPSEVDAATVAILSSFFELLVTLVGDKLFHQLIQGAWPGFAIEGKQPGPGGTQS